MNEQATSNALAILEQAPLFGGLEPDALQAALAVVRVRRFQKGSFLFHQDEPATTFYILTEGRGRLTQVTPEGHQVIIRYLSPGNGIGIIVVLSNMPYPVSAEAVTDCELLAWDGDTTVQLMEQFPRLAVNGMRLIAGRFRDLQDRYRELATERVERRVARTVIRLTRQTGKRTEEGILLDLPLSRQDLAEMTGTTLYTVSRICSKWEQQGLVEASRERLLIINPHGLVAVAEDLPNQ